MVRETKNVWESLLTEAMTKHERCGDCHVLVLGDAGSGKKTLMQKLFQMQHKTEEPFSSSLPLNYFHLPASHVDEAEFQGYRFDTMNIWTLDCVDLIDDLIDVVLPADAPAKCIVVIAVDLSKPWTVMERLKVWTKAIERKLSQVMSNEEQVEMSQKLTKYLASYKDPSERDDAEAFESTRLKAGMMKYCIGLPHVVIGCKSDAFASASDDVDTTVRLEFIQRNLRQYCLKYGASLLYTSAMSGKNCELLYNYLLHRCYAFSPVSKNRQPASANVLEKDGVFVPAGWDCEELIEGLCNSLGMDLEFNEVIKQPRPEMSVHSDVRTEVTSVLDEQEFYKKLLSKQTVEGSRRSATDAAAAALKIFNDTASTVELGSKPLSAAELLKPRNNKTKQDKAETRRVTAKDAKENPELIANFFQSLLTRDKPTFSRKK